MPADEQITAQEHDESTAAQQQSSKQVRPRQSDDGPEILPCMEHFVTVVRKAKRPGLALLLVERASATSLPELAALTDAAKGTLPWTTRHWWIGTQHFPQCGRPRSAKRHPA